MTGAGTGTIKFSATGGGPTDLVVASGAIPAFPGDLFGVPPAGSALGQISESWSTSLPGGIPFDVFLDSHAASGPGPLGFPYLFVPVGSDFKAKLEADFSVTFTLDSAGLAATSIPAISYPVFWVGSSGEVTFDVSMHYADDFGALGDRTLHLAPPIGSSGLIPVIGAGGLDLPALPGDDHITLSGSFILTADAHGGTGTELKVGTVPEPSSLTLLAWGTVFVLANWLRSRFHPYLCKSVVRKGAAHLDSAGKNLVPGGTFEEHREHGAQGWDFQDAAGQASFVDTAVRHSGKSSLRWEKAEA
jgi:hypothetical protein